MIRKTNLAASIRDRLLNRAKKEGADFSLMLTRFALERMHYRLSITEHRDHFLLKGALLFDLWVLAQYSELDGEILHEAITATFNRRGTQIPQDLPMGLTEEFANDQMKQTQWKAFLKKMLLRHLHCLKSSVSLLSY